MHPELPSRVFDDWWHHEGSGMPPLPGEDAEAHVRRICRLAWLEAADWAYGKARERAMAAVLEPLGADHSTESELLLRRAWDRIRFS